MSRPSNHKRSNTNPHPPHAVSLNENANTLDTIMDVLRSAFPDNLVEATFGKDGTEITAMTREDGSSYLERSLKVYILYQLRENSLNFKFISHPHLSGSMRELVST